MGGGGRVDHQGLGITDVGQVGGQFDLLDEPLASLVTAFDTEGEHGPGALGDVLLDEGIVGRRVAHPVHRGMRGQKPGHGPCVLDMPLHPQWKRLEAEQEEKGVEGRQRRSDISQQLCAGLGQKRVFAEVLPELEPVIGRRRFRHERKVAVVPVKAARLDDHTGDDHPVPADELGRRMDHDVGSPLHRPAQVGRGEGVVDDKRDPVVVRDHGRTFEVEDLGPGVADRLSINEFGSGGDGGGDGLGVGVDKRDIDPHPPEGHIELRVSAAIEIPGGNDLVAGLAERQDCNELSSLTGPGRQRSQAAF